MIIIERRERKFRKVFPTELSLFLMKYKETKVLYNSQEYAEIPEKVRETCNFVDNEFYAVPDEFADYYNDLVRVRAFYKTTYKIQIAKPLMIMLKAYTDLMKPVLEAVLEKTPNGKVEGILNKILQEAKILEVTDDAFYTFYFYGCSSFEKED